jgi:uncharacterized protein DUF4347
MKKRRPVPRRAKKKLTAPKKRKPTVTNKDPVPCPLVTVTLNGCITVDKSVDQNSFLEFARKRHAKPPNARHTSRQSAITNAQNCLAGGKKIVNLVGHGDQGLILTGSADLNTTDTTKFIGLLNTAAWKADLSAITHPLTSLTLLACDTGAGSDGANLLKQLATTLNVTVEAPTGLVYLASGTSDPFLEPCAQWQKATPGVLPDAILLPRLSQPDSLMTTLVLRGVDRVAIADVVSLDLYQATSVESPLIQSWSGREAQVAATYVEFDQPFEPGGVPAAIVTGMLVLTFKGATGNEQRSFRVYNRRLVQDMTYGETFYYTAIAQLVGRPVPMSPVNAVRRNKSDAARRTRRTKTRRQ